MVIYDEIHNSPGLPWEPDVWDESTALTTFLSYSKCCLWALNPWNSAQQTQLCFVDTGVELSNYFIFSQGPFFFFFFWGDKQGHTKQWSNLLSIAHEWFLLIIHHRQSMQTTKANTPPLSMSTRYHPAQETGWNKVLHPFFISPLTQDVLVGNKIIIYLYCYFVWGWFFFVVVVLLWFVLFFHTWSYQ